MSYVLSPTRSCARSAIPRFKQTGGTIRGMRRAFPIIVAALALVFVASSAAAATPLVAKVVLLPSQVGKGYLLITRSDGYGMKTRTLDLCGTKNYFSEVLRTSRLQVNYLKKTSKLGVSNEVVTYKSGGAAQAMREVTQHATTCPSDHKVDPGENNLPPLLFNITRVKDGHLIKGYLAVKIRVRGRYQGKNIDETSYAVYQRLGGVLSGVYSFGPATAAQMQLCLHAAEQSARNLRKVKAGTAGSGPTA